ncbi:hypothetical protein DLAC_06087 [Tieghemostelium lacteum]|uniref:Uncharacterized protein n=1 Tax=Tieghemostelium lacteum TaxID=361077 RepID=A0A151ZHE6_TIELA|nr:hypothetical protein DLAC_06087 [Tieghemostelium lacteum]|eukprot:KYQ93402.1 hypothetical protein DLAC_06087 [Tieghemostelium lacteum]
MLNRLCILLLIGVFSLPSILNGMEIDFPIKQQTENLPIITSFFEIIQLYVYTIDLNTATITGKKADTNHIPNDIIYNTFYQSDDYVGLLYYNYKGTYQIGKYYFENNTLEHEVTFKLPSQTESISGATVYDQVTNTISTSALGLSNSVIYINVWDVTTGDVKEYQTKYKSGNIPTSCVGSENQVYVIYLFKGNYNLLLMNVETLDEINYEITNLKIDQNSEPDIIILQALDTLYLVTTSNTNQDINLYSFDLDNSTNTATVNLIYSSVGHFYGAFPVALSNDQQYITLMGAVDNSTLLITAYNTNSQSITNVQIPNADTYIFNQAFAGFQYFSLTPK